MAAVFTSGAFAGEVRRGGSPADILSRMNSAVRGHSQAWTFVAFLLAAVDARSRTLTFANAGQTPAAASLGSSHRVAGRPGRALPAGTARGEPLRRTRRRAQSRDLILLLTDGVTEAMDTGRNSYGSERLEALLLGLPVEASAKEVLEAVRASVSEHAGTAPQHDDMTIVAIRIAGNAH